MLGDLLQKTTSTLTLYSPHRSNNVHTEPVFFLVTHVPIPDPADLRPPMGGDHIAMVLSCLALTSLRVRGEVPERFLGANL